MVNLRSLLAGPTLEKRVSMYGVDPAKAFEKLAKKQFSDPFDSIRELLANAYDSYDRKAAEKRVDVDIGEASFSITDYGCGMGVEKLRALRTLGLSDKKGMDLVGRFGIGFASLFHPALRAREVIVDSVEDLHRQLRFIIEVPGKKVSLEEYVVEEDVPYSTKIEVLLDGAKNVAEILEKVYLRVSDLTLYHPHPPHIDGAPFFTARNYGSDSHKNAVTIKKKGITGFIAAGEEGMKSQGITILSHHLPICTFPLERFHDAIGRDCGTKYNVVGVVNYDKLNPVSSRNEIQRDEAWSFLADQVLIAFEKYALARIKSYSDFSDLSARKEILPLLANYAHTTNIFETFFYHRQKFEDLAKEHPLYEAFVTIPI